MPSIKPELREHLASRGYHQLPNGQNIQQNIVITIWFTYDEELNNRGYGTVLLMEEIEEDSLVCEYLFTHIQTEDGDGRLPEW